MKRFNDWLWWTIGIRLWRRSAQQHPLAETERRLGWMKLDYDLDYERKVALATRRQEAAAVTKRRELRRLL